LANRKEGPTAFTLSGEHLDGWTGSLRNTGEHRGTRSFVKKNRTNNVLQFPQATRSAEKQNFPPSTVIFQIGSDRFAVHMQYESLPPLPPRLVSPVASATEDPKPPSLPRGPAARPKTVSKFTANRRRKARSLSVLSPIQPTD
jgi:hypothetical protein